MPHSTITNQEKEDQALVAILSRETEVQDYQVNVDNYTTMLLTLPSTGWPDTLKQYKGFTNQQIAERVSDADMDVVSDLVFADRVSFLLKTEKLEQRRAKMVYDALVASQDPLTLKSKLDAKKTELAV